MTTVKTFVFLPYGARHYAVRREERREGDDRSHSKKKRIIIK